MSDYIIPIISLSLSLIFSIILIIRRFILKLKDGSKENLNEILLCLTLPFVNVVMIAIIGMFCCIGLLSEL